MLERIYWVGGMRESYMDFNRVIEQNPKQPFTFENHDPLTVGGRVRHGVTLQQAQRQSNPPWADATHTAGSRACVPSARAEVQHVGAQFMPNSVFLVYGEGICPEQDAI